MAQMDLSSLWGSLGVEGATSTSVDDAVRKTVRAKPDLDAGSVQVASKRKTVPQLVRGLDFDQREAVMSDAEQLLVVAGAGSGKTRVFVHRIARLVAEGADPESILALSYTNAAANEVKKRLAQMGIEGVYTSTMHAWCNREPMRKFGHLIGKGTYQILDADGQEDTLRYDMRLGEHGAKRVQLEITAVKNLVEDAIGGYDVEEYNHILARRGQLDFDDLQVHALEVLQKHPEVALHYRQQYSHVLVDEYQDINPVQHEILRMLVAPIEDATGDEVSVPNFVAVGDDSQSVYGFRGAAPQFLIHFLDEFEDGELLKLERNYRTTEHILTAGNRIIDNNEDRIPKTMWTDKGMGKEIVFKELPNEAAEAAFIAGHIEKLLARKRPKIDVTDIAVLYRRHAQSEVIAQALEEAGIPYWVVADNDIGQRKGVHLRTIHSAKGLEWEAVVLAGWNDGSVPMFTVNKDPELLPEERRIAYVGVTRAKRDLLVTVPRVTKTKAGGTMPQQPSRFIEVMKGGEETEPVRRRSGNNHGGRRYGGSSGRSW